MSSRGRKNTRKPSQVVAAMGKMQQGAVEGS
jgi:hypothetical protein